MRAPHMAQMVIGHGQMVTTWNQGPGCPTSGSHAACILYKKISSREKHFRIMLTVSSATLMLVTDVGYQDFE